MSGFHMHVLVHHVSRGHGQSTSIFHQLLKESQVLFMVVPAVLSVYTCELTCVVMLLVIDLLSLALSCAATTSIG